MQEIRSSNPPVVNENFDPNKSQVQHHHKLRCHFKVFKSNL